MRSALKIVLTIAVQMGVIVWMALYSPFPHVHLEQLPGTLYLVGIPAFYTLHVTQSERLASLPTYTLVIALVVLIAAQLIGYSYMSERSIGMLADRVLQVLAGLPFIYAAGAVVVTSFRCPHWGSGV